MILYRYLGRTYVVSAILSTALCVLLFVITDFLLNLPRFGDGGDHLVTEAFNYYANALPFIVYFSIPAAALGTVLLVCYLLQRNREWEILKFTGFDMGKAVRFAALLSLLFVPPLVLLQEGLLPALSDRLLVFSTRKARAHLPRKGLVLSQGPDGVALFGSYDQRKRTFRNCRILRFGEDREVRSQGFFSAGTWEGMEGSRTRGRWVTQGSAFHAGLDGRTASGEGESNAIPSPARIEFSESRMSFNSTGWMISHYRQGEGGSEMGAEIGMRFAYPLLPVLITVLGLQMYLLFRKPSFPVVLVALLTGFGVAYILSSSLFMFSARGVIPVFAGTYIPVACLSVAVVLLSFKIRR